MAKEYMSEQEHLGRLERNRVKVISKMSKDPDGNDVCTARIIKPSVAPGLKVLSSIMALTTYFQKRGEGRYIYEMGGAA